MIGPRYIVKKTTGKQDHFISLNFTFLYTDPTRANVKDLIEHAFLECSGEERDHNLLYAYRVYLDLNQYPPLPHHKYMYDHLPAGPYTKK